MARGRAATAVGASTGGRRSPARPVVAVSAITPCTEALFAPDNDAVIASVGDVEAAIRTTRGHKPDVLVMDLNMPGGSSLAAIPDDLLLVQ